jgi:hypothetical protein
MRIEHAGSAAADADPMRILEGPDVEGAPRNAGI